MQNNWKISASKRRQFSELTYGEIKLLEEAIAKVRPSAQDRKPMIVDPRYSWQTGEDAVWKAASSSLKIP